ncbi:flagellar basal-body rod protein FlgF [Lentilitoribacter sp. EG35]|jgi:flagellar basal-body rod protein FlgF|uniref:flagellar basal-body rod protein FlgF n=1 Tax=Lentilitoribacter sp. EG35 TaxID=3234192 RepID=UPI00345FF435
MQSALYVSLSSQIALERRLTTISGNIANANTTGFRATEIKFSEVLDGVGKVKTSFVSQGNDFLSTESGGLQSTGNAFDFAVKGDAWFMVEGPAGPMLTRDGRFTMTTEGELTTVNGFPVLDAGGAPIQLDSQAGEPTATQNGALSQNGQTVANIGLFTVDLSAGYQRVAELGVLSKNVPEPVVDQTDVGVHQGYIEKSNVNPLSEISELIQVSRAFENSTSMMRDTDKTFKEAIRTLGGGR